MPVRQGAAHHDGLLIGRRHRSALEQRAQAFDDLGRPLGQVRDGALLDLAPASKLATARMLDPLTAAFSLGETLGLGSVDEDELYVALDWLGERQEAVEKALARKHLRAGTLVLYDVSSSYSGGALLRAGAARLQPRRQEGQAADCLRPAVRGRRLPGGDRGIRGQHRRSAHARRADRQGEMESDTGGCPLNSFV